MYLSKKQPFSKKIILADSFGKQFLEKEEEKVLDDSNYTFINQVKRIYSKKYR